MVNSPEPQLNQPILQRWSQFDDLLKTEFWIVRDDLLPFPLPGNKVRKISAELDSLNKRIDVLITNGGVDSNHCRTLAMFAAQRGLRAHLVLHGSESADHSTGLRILSALGATYEVGKPDSIHDRISAARQNFRNENRSVHVVPGGGHSAAGALSFAEAGRLILKDFSFDQVFVASGTGATQGGLIAAAASVSRETDVIGVSVARDRDRGIPPVAEAAKWAGCEEPNVIFWDKFRAGGYGFADKKVAEAVNLGWAHGLPLDYTYTGKAFSAILDAARRELLGSRVLFWHTGGLWNWLADLPK